MERQVALITGGSKGIGRAIARRLAAKGMDLFLTGRNDNDLRDLINELSVYNVFIDYCLVDFMDPEAPSIILNAFQQRFNRLDHLINNAGYASSASFEETTCRDWDSIMSVNAKAPFFLTQHMLPLLKQAINATIINISSVVGRKGYAGQAAYTASKHALTGWTKVLAKEVRENGIRVHLIAPGGVYTNMVKTMRPDLDPEGLIKPEEIAELVDFLIHFKGQAMVDEINVRRNNSQPWD